VIVQEIFAFRMASKNRNLPQLHRASRPMSLKLLDLSLLTALGLQPIWSPENAQFRVLCWVKSK
jgi:hypothetical protein